MIVPALQGELTIVYEQGDNGIWIATILEYPGAFSQGMTPDEARMMVLDALNELMLSYRDTHNAAYVERTDVIRERL
jgi:predicted RNase H-like HicB family nuclease